MSMREEDNELFLRDINFSSQKKSEDKKCGNDDTQSENINDKGKVTKAIQSIMSEHDFEFLEKSKRVLPLQRSSSEEDFGDEVTRDNDPVSSTFTSPKSVSRLRGGRFFQNRCPFTDRSNFNVKVGKCKKPCHKRITPYYTLPRKLKKPESSRKSKTTLSRCNCQPRQQDYLSTDMDFINNSVQRQRSLDPARTFVPSNKPPPRSNKSACCCRRFVRAFGQSYPACLLQRYPESMSLTDEDYRLMSRLGSNDIGRVPASCQIPGGRTNVLRKDVNEGIYRRPNNVGARRSCSTIESTEWERSPGTASTTSFWERKYLEENDFKRNPRRPAPVKCRRQARNCGCRICEPLQTMMGSSGRMKLQRNAPVRVLKPPTVLGSTLKGRKRKMVAPCVCGNRNSKPFIDRVPRTPPWGLRCPDKNVTNQRTFPKIMQDAFVADESYDRRPQLNETRFRRVNRVPEIRKDLRNGDTLPKGLYITRNREQMRCCCRNVHPDVLESPRQCRYPQNINVYNRQYSSFSNEKTSGNQKSILKNADEMNSKEMCSCCECLGTNTVPKNYTNAERPDQSTTQRDLTSQNRKLYMDQNLRRRSPSNKLSAEQPKEFRNPSENNLYRTNLENKGKIANSNRLCACSVSTSITDLVNREIRSMERNRVKCLCDGDTDDEVTKLLPCTCNRLGDDRLDSRQPYEWKTRGKGFPDIANSRQTFTYKSTQKASTVPDKPTQKASQEFSKKRSTEEKPEERKSADKDNVTSGSLSALSEYPCISEKPAPNYCVNRHLTSTNVGSTQTGVMGTSLYSNRKGRCSQRDFNHPTFLGPERSNPRGDPVRILESFCKKVKALKSREPIRRSRSSTSLTIPNCNCCQCGDMCHSGIDPKFKEHSKSFKPLKAAQGSSRKTEIVTGRKKFHGSNKKKMLIFPPPGEEGPPLTLYKRSSDIDCKVKGDVNVGYRYNVTYVQTFVSSVWCPQKEGKGTMDKGSGNYQCSTDYG